MTQEEQGKQGKVQGARELEHAALQHALEQRDSMPAEFAAALDRLVEQTAQTAALQREAEMLALEHALEQRDSMPTEYAAALDRLVEQAAQERSRLQRPWMA